MVETQEPIDGNWKQPAQTVRPSQHIVVVVCVVVAVFLHRGRKFAAKRACTEPCKHTSSSKAITPALNASLPRSIADTAILVIVGITFIAFSTSWAHEDMDGAVGSRPMGALTASKSSNMTYLYPAS